MKNPNKKNGSHSKKFQKAFKVYLMYGKKRKEVNNCGYTDKQLQIKRLLWLCGGGGAIMERLKISRSAVSRWVEREDIPAKYFRVLSEMSEGRLTVPMIAAVIID